MSMPLLTDPTRLMICAHELAHATVFRDVGFRPESITVRGTGRRTVGAVDCGRATLGTTSRIRDYLIGVLAGTIAGNRWRETYAPRLPFDESAEDAHNLRWAVRLPLARELSTNDLRHEARVRVGERWAEITRLAPVLAERGTIRL